MAALHQRHPRASLEALESRSLLSSIPGFDYFFHLLHPGWSGHSRSAQVRTDPRTSHAPTASNVVYTTSGSPQTLDVYQPNGTPPRGGWPVVLAIHGGGWRRFNKEEYARKVAGPLLDNGFAVVAPDYQLSNAGSASWPANFLQIRQSVLWIRANAGRYGFNPAQVAAMGESAGGQLAGLLGTNPDGPLAAHSAQSSSLPVNQSSRVQAVVDFFGPSDLAAIDQQSAHARPAVEQFIGGPPTQFPASYAAASPVDHVTSSAAPMLILQGSADNVVPMSQSQELAAALSAAGVRNQLEILPGAQHGFGFDVPGRDLLSEVIAFLRSTLHVGQTS